MPKLRLQLGLIIAVLAASPAPVLAFRCGTDVVREGDHLYEVYEKCGPPEYRDHRVEYFFQGYQLGRSGVYEERQVPIEVDEWIYNFGKRRFKRFLRFENRILKEIETLDYGN